MVAARKTHGDARDVLPIRMVCRTNTFQKALKTKKK